MVFTDNKPSTEPFSLIFLKKICSIALVIILLIYTYEQFSQFSDSIVAPNIVFRKQNLLRTVTNYKDTSIIMRVCSSYPINCTYNNEECRLDENRDYYTTTCDSANSFRYAFDYREKTATIKISPFVTEVYLEGLVLDDKYYPPNKLSLRQLFLVSEQTMVVYYTITISKRIVSDYAYGLAGGEGIEFVEFNAHTVPVATLITPNATTLILMPISTDIYYQEETYYDIGSIISNIGGFFSSLSGFFIFLFGATKLAPWGILPTHVFNCLCTKYQRKLIRKLKNKYEPIPFVSGRTKNVTLEERVQGIENILKEYYLDTDFLNLLLIKYNKVDDNKIDDKV